LMTKKKQQQQHANNQTHVNMADGN
jgi:hypothetical protein